VPVKSGSLEPGSLEPGLLEPGLLEPGLLEPKTYSAGLLPREIWVFRSPNLTCWRPAFGIESIESNVR
jgi:hypothetical protein